MLSDDDDGANLIDCLRVYVQFLGVGGVTGVVNVSVWEGGHAY